MINLWHINNVDWLRELSATSVAALREGASISTFEPGQLVFEPEAEPQFVFILETGLVRMYRNCARGEEVTFGYIQPGEVFGELAAFSDKPRESYAVAVERSTVIKIEKQVFAEAIQSRSSIVFSVAAQIGDRFKEIESRVEDLVFRNARSRLAHIILQLAEDFGEKTGDRLLIATRLTHAELATLVGVSRPTVSIALGEFEDDELITRSEGKIVVVNKKALQAAADATD